MEFFNYVCNKLYEISGIGHLTFRDVYIVVGSVMGVFLLEFVCVGWERSSLKRVLKFDKTIRTDLYCWLLESVKLFNFVTFLVTFGVFYYVLGIVQKNVHFNLGGLISNHYVQFLIIFIVGDFKAYFRHAVFHRYTFLWKTHEFHHSATTLSIITRYRGHFLETAISTIFDVAMFVILGAPALLFIYLNILLEIHKMIIHSSIKSDWGFIGKYILVSPAAHRVHHSIETEHYNKNFGSTLIIWDRLFNTYHPGVEVKEVGIPRSPYNKKGYIVDVWIGFRNFVRSLFKR